MKGRNGRSVDVQSTEICFEIKGIDVDELCLRAEFSVVCFSFFIVL